jgi:hypothetical protein
MSFNVYEYNRSYFENRKKMQSLNRTTRLEKKSNYCTLKHLIYLNQSEFLCGKKRSYSFYRMCYYAISPFCLLTRDERSQRPDNHCLFFRDIGLHAVSIYTVKSLVKMSHTAL